jgi:tetratricopeptide (TPR) repeat protein
MDCRRSLSLLALCLMGACAGCVTQPQVPGGSAAQLMGVQAGKLSPPPPRKPSADFCVAVGDLRAGAADKESGTLQQQMRDEARQSYQRALDINSKCTKAYLGLGQLYVRMADYDRALAIYDKGLRKLPKDAALWCDRGFCLCCKKDWAAGLESMKKAYTLQPENREFGTHYGLALARAGKLDDSIACLTKFQGKAEAYYTVARMLAHLNRPEQSKQLLQTALALQPDLAPARDMLARLDGRPAEGDRSVATAGYQEAVP